MKVHAHRLVARTAKEMAEALYEECMTDNAVYAHWKSLCPDLSPNILRVRFVKLMLPNLLDAARATLAKMISTPLTEQLKAEIYDALILDSAFKRGPATAERQHLTLQ
jgi:hypothetical protein